MSCVGLNKNFNIIYFPKIIYEKEIELKTYSQKISPRKIEYNHIVSYVKLEDHLSKKSKQYCS